MFDRDHFERVLSDSCLAFRLLCPPNQPPFLFGIHHPRRIVPEDLLGRSSQIQILQKNLSGFSQGLPPVPTLIYGHRGTGKTSLVLALWNEWNRRNSKSPLKIIQADRQGIDFLSPVIDLISTRSDLFLILLDDLVFPREDSAFHQMKALLDGGVIGSPENAGLIVTSNVRHLVSESKTTTSDALHPQEERDDSLALYDRFGLTIFFDEPSLEDYLLLVLTKSCNAGILSGLSDDWQLRWTSWLKDSLETRMDPSDKDIRILRLALRFSRDKASRSGRTAQSFVDLLSRKLLEI